MNQPSCNPDYRDSLRKQILDLANCKFTTIGVKSVKMDDIARELKISKRTLYEIYENKEQLLLESVERNIHAFNAQMESFCDQCHVQVIDVILKFYRLQMESIRDLNPVFYEDLHKYPRVVAFIEHMKKEQHAHSKDFFKRGVQDGYFRGDFNYELISQLGDSMMQKVMEDKLYKKYGLQYILRNVIMLFIRGLCTAKGIQELDRQLDCMP